MTHQLRIGLVLNPYAGIGGPVGLKGSDGVFEQALARGGRSKVAERVSQCLQGLPHERIEWLTLSGSMGAELLAALGIASQVVFAPALLPTTAEDTRVGVSKLCEQGIDLLLFAGGDGTARDVADGFAHTPAVLGIPCGVKMHSGVFATTPAAAAELIGKLIAGEVLSVVQAEVRDIDEASFRDGHVTTRFYAELPVPDDLRYVQQTKVGGREVEALAVQDMAADFIEHIEPDVLYLMGSGSTVATIMEAVGQPATLLGIDVLLGDQLLLADASEQQLIELLKTHDRAQLVVTAISGQGHVFGRGNQQLSPAVIRAVGLDNILIVASKTKLAGLHGRPLLVDTGDPELDQALSGMKSVLTGYDDRVLYRLD